VTASSASPPTTDSSSRDGGSGAGTFDELPPAVDEAKPATWDAPYLLQVASDLEVGRDRQEVRRIPRRGLGLVDGLRGELVDAAGAAAAVPRVALGRGRRRRRAARAFERRAAGRGAGDDVDEVAERDPRQADAVVEVLGDALVAGGGYIS